MAAGSAWHQMCVLGMTERRGQQGYAHDTDAGRQGRNWMEQCVCGEAGMWGAWRLGRSGDGRECGCV